MSLGLMVLLMLRFLEYQMCQRWFSCSMAWRGHGSTVIIVIQSIHCWEQVVQEGQNIYVRVKGVRWLKGFGVADHQLNRKKEFSHLSATGLSQSANLCFCLTSYWRATMNLSVSCWETVARRVSSFTLRFLATSGRLKSKGFYWTLRLIGQRHQLRNPD